jgi:hypothetical protein
MRKLSSALLRGGALLLLCGLAVFFCLRKLAGETGLVEIGDDEVAVLYNCLDGTTRVVDTPGNELYVPFVERLHVLRRSTAELLFEGVERVGAHHVPAVRMRAADGSLVYFESLSLRYTLRSDGAKRALEDARGREDWAAQLIESRLRAAVHAEYGTYGAEEIRLRENQNVAGVVTLARLNLALEIHGIEVREMSTPKLRFDTAYETAVAARKAAIQEIEQLKAEFSQLDAERGQRLAAVEKDKLIELNKTRLQAQDYLAILGKEERARRAKAEATHASRVAQANNKRYSLEQEALALSEKFELNAAVLREEVQLLASIGAPLVREAWIERLAHTPFKIQPFSHDPEPAGVEVLRTALADH